MDWRKKYNDHRTSKHRPTWDEYFKEIVQVTATHSPCDRLQVGCPSHAGNRLGARDTTEFYLDVDTNPWFVMGTNTPPFMPNKIVSQIVPNVVYPLSIA